MQTYSTKSTAARGARRAGHENGAFEVMQNADGRWYFVSTTTWTCSEGCREGDLYAAPVHYGLVEAEDKGCKLRHRRRDKKAIPLKRRSEVFGPTKLVWAIAETMHKANPNVRRSDVIRYCVEKGGIAYYTARTQYQYWFKAKNRS